MICQKMKTKQNLHFIVFTLCIFVQLNQNCLAQSNQRTYRSSIEKTIQGVTSVGKKITGILTPANFAVGEAGALKSYQGFSSFLNHFKNQVRAIFPGTRWCGDGNRAGSDNDVGLFKRTDFCCRQHDMCPFNIKGGSTFGPLLNDGLFTRSSCTCDREFYDCLKNVNSPVAFDIGHTYFTILGPQCIGYGYPIVSCLRRSGKRLVHRKCVEYQVDTSRDDMIFQWTDNPDF